MKSGSSLRPSVSLSDLGEKRAFDVKVGYRKKIPPLGSSDKAPKALYVTVFRNGDPYFPGTKVSLRPGKHFLNLSGFCDYLSQRMKIPQGVRYIYDINGRLITELKDLEDGGSYVASGVKTFKDAGYGKLVRLHTTQKPNAAPLRPDDMLLFRQPHHESLEGLSLPGSKESCLVTVVNKKEPAKRSRVLLNLRTRQIWEDVLKDMGQSIGMRKVSRMLTPWGEEVRSFSHLKNDFGDVETFYLDTKSKRSGPRRSNSDSNIRGTALGSSLRIKIPDGRNR
ncbi:echinoderm microtubule-associated protein-like CG42247 [Caerostris darwini]|uniref:Echinoderm microtubule-associated protein-like CG42247 n=2 Tax=Caerostris TaxID=172845 RepID=A0AAV4M7U5_9ARAC|nr:echinoderm microtubule-associated protein-like CG42247 [Caerostris darwini]GIY31462.1 echinoderm microtubule-associated protein-like CG42247 [Caerostris extrusa]